jgi:hypothetical protein
MTKFEEVAVTRCTARTKAGDRCSRPADPGATRCKQHPYRMPGRPSKLTVALTAELVWLILEGNYVETAAQAVGVDKTTLYRWLRRGEDALARAEEEVEDGDALLGDGIYNHTDPSDWPYIDFRHALKSAEAFAETELLRKVQWPSTSAWQAFATILERRHPARWKRREAVEHEGAVGVRAEVIVPDTEERRAKVIGILGEALKSSPDLKAAIAAPTPKRRTRKK